MFSLVFFFVLEINAGFGMENCTSLRENFALSTATFTACAIENSKPVTLCENCISSYLDVYDSFNNLSHFVDNETKCIDELINLDSLQIITTLYSSSYNLWNKAKCYECYQIINGTLTPNKSKKALIFEQHYVDFYNCSHKSGINETTMCHECLNYYVALNDYYNTINDENESIGVCMDIVDKMNTTRAFWSKPCCKYRKHNEYIFLASSITVLIVTLGFYIVVQFCAVKYAPTILQQRRLAESFSHSNNYVGQ